jgi:hypothetical protein
MLLLNRTEELAKSRIASTVSFFASSLAMRFTEEFAPGGPDGQKGIDPAQNSRNFRLSPAKSSNFSRIRQRRLPFLT